MVSLEANLYTENNFQYLNHFFKQVTDLKREDNDGYNIFDYAMTFLNDKEIYECVANKFIDAGGKISKVHLVFAKTIECEQKFIERL